MLLIGGPAPDLSSGGTAAWLQLLGAALVAVHRHAMQGLASWRHSGLEGAKRHSGRRGTPSVSGLRLLYHDPDLEQPPIPAASTAKASRCSRVASPARNVFLRCAHVQQVQTPTTRGGCSRGPVISTPMPAGALARGELQPSVMGCTAASLVLR